METRGNPLVTRTLLFIAQGGGNVGAAPPAAGSGITLPPPETRKLYAFDKATGRRSGRRRRRLPGRWPRR